MSKLLAATKRNFGPKPATQPPARAGARSRFCTLRHRMRAVLRPERGQALVEFAIALPVLLLIVLGILDFGRAVNYWNDETHVANLAARYAAVGVLPSDKTCGTGSAYGVNETLSQYITCELGLDSSELQSGAKSPKITVCVPANVTNPSVTVILTSQYQWLPFLGVATSTVQGTATQMIENTVPATWSTSTANPCPTS